MAKYPKEDKCSECGAHIGWIMNETGELMTLGLCDECADHTDPYGEPSNPQRGSSDLIPCLLLLLFTLLGLGSCSLYYANLADSKIEALIAKVMGVLP